MSDTQTQKNIPEKQAGNAPAKVKEKTGCSVSGSKNKEFTNIVASQAMQNMWTAHSSKEERSTQMEATIAALRGIAPKDEIEGMMAAQMVSIHNASMECFRRAMNREQSFIGRDANLKHATKLTRSYTALVDSLQKYRGKSVSEQKVTVQHVHVSDGGQAIVGNVDHSGRGGRPIKKIVEPPHAP